MQKGRLVFTGREFLFIVTALLLFFQIYLQTTIGFMQFFDELVAVACLIKVFQAALTGKLEKCHAKILLIMVVVAGIGLVGGMLSEVQTKLAPILTDIGNTFKVFIVYLGSTYYLKNVSNKRRIVSALASAIRLFVVILFVCMLLHFAGVLNMGNDVRYGIKSFQFVNRGAGQLSFMFYAIMLILTVDIKYQKRKHDKVIYIIMALVVWASTLRSRAFMFVLIYCYFYWLLVMQQERFRLNIRNGVAMLAAGILFGMDQYETYFSNTVTARYNLLFYGIHTMQRFFPLGSGFATYGTDAAVKYYSILYDEYGFDRVYGLSRSFNAFAHDTYWPAIMAQFGVFGAVLMIILLFRVFKDMLKRANKNQYCYFGALFLCVTQVVSSIATATFFHFVTVGLFFLVPLLFDSNDNKPL